jgi:predicted dinucleotide-binding enzyme
MRIGILGSGDVGKQLARGFLMLGDEVKVGTRAPEKLKEWAYGLGMNISVGNLQEASEFGEVIVIATSWYGAENAIKLAGKKNFSEKIVIDVTNPLDFSKGVPSYIGGVGKSAGEHVQKWLPEAKVVKAFNTVGNSIMCNPHREEGDPDLFIAGNMDAKKFVVETAKKWGWKNIVDMGEISNAYLLESLAMVWIEFGSRNESYSHAIKILRK